MSEIDQQIIDFLRIIADQTRLDILKLLKDGEKTSTNIRETLNKSHSTISQHLKSLIDNNLVDFEKKEREIQVKKRKNPGIVEVTKEIKHYFIKNERVFEVLNNIRSFVDSKNKDKMEEFINKGVKDTLT